MAVVANLKFTGSGSGSDVYAAMHITIAYCCLVVVVVLVAVIVFQ